MRPSVLSFVLLAGALLSLQLCAGAGAAAAAACCAESELSESSPAPASGGGGAEAVEVVLPPANVPTAPTPLPLTSREGVDKSSYADVFRILKTDNRCSRYFGGPHAAVTVFNQFTLRLRKRSLGAGAVAIAMYGDYTNYRDTVSGASYRLFDEAAVNTQGPFTARVPQPATARLRIGRFPVETRQAKALILLHELGHLIRGKDGKWLLPEDGGDAELSERNTGTVQGQCLGELLALGG